MDRKKAEKRGRKKKHRGDQSTKEELPLGLSHLESCSYIADTKPAVPNGAKEVHCILSNSYS